MKHLDKQIIRLLFLFCVCCKWTGSFTRQHFRIFHESPEYDFIFIVQAMLSPPVIMEISYMIVSSYIISDHILASFFFPKNIFLLLFFRSCNCPCPSASYNGRDPEWPFRTVFIKQYCFSCPFHPLVKYNCYLQILFRP